MNCWYCKKELQDIPKKIPFKATCDYCAAWLHCCKNCRYYSPGRHNDCLIPDTDYVGDRERSNFCDSFEVNKQNRPDDGPSKSDVEKRLFGSDDEEKKPDDEDPKERLRRLLGE